jgi:protein phosphatase
VEHTDTEAIPLTRAPAFRQVLAAGATDRGLVRERNEDHFVVAEMTRAMRIQATSLPQPSTMFGGERVRGHLFVVADGMGGHAAGEEASALAVVTIEDFLLNTLRWFFRIEGDNVLTEFWLALRAADERIFAEVARRPGLRGMGTTVTLAFAVESTLYAVHAGDSRLYVLRGGRLYQMTNDHTVVGELLRRRIIDAEHAAQHPMRNIITNSVGGDQPGVQPEVHKIPLEADDTMLLCTDGLTEMVSDEVITAVLTGTADPQAACGTLIEQANKAGGVDNVTAIVARFVA